MPTPEARRGRIGHLYELLIGEERLDDFLAGLPGLVVERLNTTVSCGLTAYKEGGSVTVASSDDMAAELDRVQDEAGEGPCLEAISTGQAVEVTDLATLAKWPAWRRRAVDLGLQRSLSLPLTGGGNALGAFNLYSTGDGPFTSDDRAAAELFVAHAAGALMLAIRLAEFAELTGHLESALTSRAAIDQAKGIIMAEQRCTPDQAFTILRKASQNRNVKLRDLAVQLVAQVSEKPDDDAA